MCASFVVIASLRMERVGRNETGYLYFHANDKMRGERGIPQIVYLKTSTKTREQFYLARTVLKVEVRNGVHSLLWNPVVLF